MTELSHAIIFVSDMARSVAFYRDVLGLPVRFESAKWTEFETAGSTLALHLADVPSNAAAISADAIPAGLCHLSFAVDDLDAFHQEMIAKGIPCLQRLEEEDFGGRLAGYADPDQVDEDRRTLAMPYGLRGCRQNDLHDQCPLAKYEKDGRKPLPDVRGAMPGDGEAFTFPTPEKLAAASERELQDAKLGFRAQRVGEFVRRVVGGDLDLDAWCREKDTDALRETILTVKGIGNYAANHLLMLLGHYDQIPCDSEVRAYLGISAKASQKEVERVAAKRYGHWGRFTYLAYKFERVFAKENYVDC